MREYVAVLLEQVEAESITEERPYVHQADHSQCDPKFCLEAAYLAIEEENQRHCEELRMA